jgi:hypothetical protein
MEWHKLFKVGTLRKTLKLITIKASKQITFRIKLRIRIVVNSQGFRPNMESIRITQITKDKSLIVVDNQSLVKMIKKCCRPQISFGMPCISNSLISECYL